jgi:hypothetical protein
MNQKPPLADPTDRVMTIPAVESPRHDEALLDQAVAETFPASDPIAPAVAARMEPADREVSTSTGPRWSGRVRRHTPALVAIGTAALALLAMSALRGDRRRRSDFEA